MARAASDSPVYVSSHPVTSAATPSKSPSVAGRDVNPGGSFTPPRPSCAEEPCGRPPSWRGTWPRTSSPRASARTPSGGASSSAGRFFAASTLALSAAIRSTTFAVGSASTNSISSPAIFASTILSSASRYSSVNSSGFQSAVRFSISVFAMSSSWSRTVASTSTPPKSASRISSGQYMVSRTNASSLKRSADRCSLSRKLTFAIPTLFTWLMASRSSAYALAPVSSGIR